MKSVISSVFFLLSATLFAQTFVDKAEELGVLYSYDECFLAGGVSFTDFDMDGIDD
ncbi:MAG: hypothetical protein HKN32_05170, partial [Flavobacteriales bacterium]|nr:hypothetical protein [Flavobacteriales bacterium]